MNPYFHIGICAASLLQMFSTSLLGAERPNVLFIVVDDLRPTLGCYEDKVAVTPNIDRLAAEGMCFQNAFCQLAVCCPSRLSLLSGRRPDAIQVWDLKTHFREAHPELISLPQHFRNNGYFTQSIGKVFHGSGKPSKDPISWSKEPLFDYVRDPKLRYGTKHNLSGEGLKRDSYEAAAVSDDYYVDGKVCNAALAALKNCERENQPFFLAVGFRKPHLPFCAPTKYWELYEPLGLPSLGHSEHPSGAPEFATRSWLELEGYRDIPDSGPATENKVQLLRQGYYACVSYVDALVGKLLGQLGELDLANDTIVVLWSDHGFHLGEQGLWTKANNYELSTRVPLIISVPSQTKPELNSKFGRCDALVELVDVYPTLVDLCNLPPVDGLEGTSLLPLWSDPMQAWKPVVFHQYPRMMKGSRHKSHGEVMGYAVRSKSYRYVAWRDWQTQKTLSHELYDMRVEPVELKNLADNAEHFAILQQMQRYLDEGWRAAVPSVGR
ncbi:MAG: sulfatase [Planctomycetota bacterium]